MEKYLVYCIDKGLSVTSTEMSNHFYLTAVREDGCDQRGPFVYREGMGNQAFPCRGAAAPKERISPTDA